MCCSWRWVCGYSVCCVFIWEHSHSWSWMRLTHLFNTAHSVHLRSSGSDLSYSLTFLFRSLFLYKKIWYFLSTMSFRCNTYGRWKSPVTGRSTMTFSSPKRPVHKQHAKSLMILLILQEYLKVLLRFNALNRYICEQVIKNGPNFLRCRCTYM